MNIGFTKLTDTEKKQRARSIALKDVRKHLETYGSGYQVVQVWYTAEDECPDEAKRVTNLKKKMDNPEKFQVKEYLNFCMDYNIEAKQLITKAVDVLEEG